MGHTVKPSTEVMLACKGMLVSKNMMSSGPTRAENSMMNGRATCFSNVNMASFPMVAAAAQKLRSVDAQAPTLHIPPQVVRLRRIGLVDNKSELAQPPSIISIQKTGRACKVTNVTCCTRISADRYMVVRHQAALVGLVGIDGGRVRRPF